MLRQLHHAGVEHVTGAHSLAIGQEAAECMAGQLALEPRKTPDFTRPQTRFKVFLP
ncbi:MAG: hypothetical protein JW990_02615 [Thermoleophilia bacterium]|nr:hypothetical protein [Thermoleophilia bacterium]